MFYHVEEYEAHYNHIELLVGHNSKYDRLRAPLRPRQGFQWLLAAGFLHGGDVLLLVLRHESVQRAAFILLFIELVNDHANKKVESKEAAEHNEGNKEEIGIDVGFIVGLEI